MAEQLRTPGAPEVDFDHYSPLFGDRYFDVARELNRLGVAYSPHHGGFYVIAGYEQVNQALVDPATFRSGRPADEPELQGILIPSNYHGLPVVPAECDGKQHRDLRKAMLPQFSKQAAEAWRGRFLHWATVLIDDAVETGTIDLAAEYANPLAFIFAVELLGLPVEDWRKWQEPAHGVNFAPPGSTELEWATDLWAANLAELAETIRDRRANPADDFISLLAGSEIDGEPIPDEDVLSLCVIVMLGAVDTTSSLMTNALVHLDEHPELRAGLAADEAALAVAIEEWLRYFTPTHGTGRTVAKDTEVGGCPMHRGDRVMLSYLSANHDPAKFTNPDAIDLARSPNPHLAFAGGVHKCVGLHFARIEALMGIQQVLLRLPDYELRHEGRVDTPNAALVRGHFHLPADFTPGRRVTAQRAPGARASGMH